MQHVTDTYQYFIIVDILLNFISSHLYTGVTFVVVYICRRTWSYHAIQQLEERFSTFILWL